MASLDLIHVVLALALAAVTYYYNRATTQTPGTPPADGTPALPSVVAPGGWLGHLLQVVNNAHDLATGPILGPLLKNVLASIGQAAAPIPAPLQFVGSSGGVPLATVAQGVLASTASASPFRVPLTPHVDLPPTVVPQGSAVPAA